MRNKRKVSTHLGYLRLELNISCRHKFVYLFVFGASFRRQLTNIYRILPFSITVGI